MLLAGAAEQLEPTATYDPDGDCIEFFAKPDPFYTERVDDLLTVYYSRETGEVTGSLLKGASRFCKQALEKMPGFRVEIHDGRIQLVCRRVGLRHCRRRPCKSWLAGSKPMARPRSRREREGRSFPIATATINETTPGIWVMVIK